MMIRAFLAIELPSDVLDEIIYFRNDILGEETVNWERKDKLHITLKFFGEIEKSLIMEISKILKDVSSSINKFSLSFSKFGFFKQVEVPKVLFLGLDRNDELNKLFHILERRFEKIGIQKEQRNFIPHLTLLRIKSNKNSYNIFENKSVGNLSFECDSLSLMKSELKSTGSVYTRINKYYFKEA